MKNNIALIGFMGTGKTVTGRALAIQLAMDFIDLDKVIEEKAGRTVAAIFAEQGEAAFRAMEVEVLLKACRRHSMVIACGGGVVLNKQNIDALNKSAMVVYLTAEPATILQRIESSGEKRPLLEVADPLSAINDMLEFRTHLYEKVADIIVDTTGLTTNSIVRQIISELGNDESFNFQKQHTG